eukprot:7375810-Prymnesium_polylepis.3
MRPVDTAASPALLPCRAVLPCRAAPPCDRKQAGLASLACRRSLSDSHPALPRLTIGVRRLAASPTTSASRATVASSFLTLGSPK